MSAVDWPVEIDPVYGCWVWQAKKDKDGYGVQWKGQSRPVLAHRLVYETEVGPIPAGRELDHACRIRACVAPHHLELVTRRENVRAIQWRQRTRKTHCPKGHDLYLMGRTTPWGGKICMVCIGLK